MTTALSVASWKLSYSGQMVMPNKGKWQCAIADHDPPAHYRPDKYMVWYNYKEDKLLYTFGGHSNYGWEIDIDRASRRSNPKYCLLLADIRELTTT